MAISWSGPSPKNNCYVGIEFLGVETGNVTAVIYLQCSHYFNDGVNTVTVSGSMSWSGSKNINISAQQRNQAVELMRLSGSWAREYGRTVDGYITVTISGVEYTGTMRHTASFSIPQADYQAPDPATNVTATWQEGDRIALAWQRNSTDGYGAKPVSSFRIMRTTDGAQSWQQVAEVPWGQTTWTDSTLPANEVACYAIQQVGPGGASAWWSGYSYSPWMFTTPAAPTMVAARKGTGLQVVVSWRANQKEKTNATVHEVWDGDTLVAQVAYDQASYTIPDPDPSRPHTYRVRTLSGGVASAFADAPAVTVLAAPYAPEGLTPAGGWEARNSYVTLAWRHAPRDGTAQTAFEVSYSLDGGGSWRQTRQSTATQSYRLYVSASSVQWRVRTWGQDATKAGDWSPVASFQTETAPTTTILSPTSSQTITTSTMRVEFTSALPDAVMGEVELYEGSTFIAKQSPTRVAGKFTAVFDGVANGKSYTVKARTGVHVYSAWTSRTVKVAYTPSPAPVLVQWRFSASDGAITGSIIPGTSTGGQPSTARMRVERQRADGTWETITEGSGAGALPFTDSLCPILEKVNYRFAAVSNTGVEALSPVRPFALPAGRVHAWLNVGGGLATAIPLAGDLDINESSGLVFQEMHYFDDGTGLPTLIEGRQRQRVFALSFRLAEHAERLLADRLRDAGATPGVKVLRLPGADPIYGALSGVSIRRPIGGKILACTATFTEVHT